jgi:hypothetical protein
MKSDPARNNKPPPASPTPNMQPAGQGMEISSCLRRGAFRRRAFGPNGDGLEDFGPCWTPRGHYVYPSAPREPTRARAYDFEHGGTRYTAGIGRFKDCALAENSEYRKPRTAIVTNDRDAAVAASLLCQDGCYVDALRPALTRSGDGSASGPLARVLNLLAEGI